MGTPAGLAQLGVYIKGRGRGTQTPPESPGERPGQEGLGIMTLSLGVGDGRCFGESSWQRRG